MSDDKKQRIIKAIDYILEVIVYVVWIPLIIAPDRFNIVIAAGVVIGATILLKCWKKVRGEIPYKEKIERIRKTVETIMMTLAGARLLVEAVIEFW